MGAAHRITAYVAGYAAIRFFVEALQIDPATRVLGLRVNLWLSAVTFLIAVAVIVLRSRTAKEAADEPADELDVESAPQG